MNRDKPCDLLKEAAADPRVPIKLNKKFATYALIVNSESRTAMNYCPFCGEKLVAGAESIPGRQRSCRHLQQLSLQPESSVRFRPSEKEFWLFGHHSHLRRLFYCPICGSKLRLAKSDGRFYTPSAREVAV